MAEEETTATETPPEGEPTPPETPAAPVEPKLGWSAFVQGQKLRPAAAKGFQAWMRQHGHDPAGYYDLATWSAWREEAWAYEVTT
jgi:hypothetical protein